MQYEIDADYTQFDQEGLTRENLIQNVNFLSDARAFFSR